MITDKEKEMFQELFEYYFDIIRDMDSSYLCFADDCNKETLIRLVTEAKENTSNYPAHKLHRWLGFVQGILISTGELSVTGEREYTRSIIHNVYGVGKSFDATTV
jgi:hypothetical protein